MPRLARSKQCSRTGSLTARKRRSRLPRTRYLANPASLIGIPRLEAAHAGSRISFGSSALTVLAQTLVEIGLATESDWTAAEKTPSALVDPVFRRYLADHGQYIIAEHFELSLTLGEAIVDSVYGEAAPTCPGQLFFVLNTESSFPLGVGDAITELEGVCAGMGQAFYDTLRQALYRWIRVYDDLDARERIEQMTEWAEGEDDPESYEIPKLEQDLPPCSGGQAAFRHGPASRLVSGSCCPMVEGTGRNHNRARASLPLDGTAQGSTRSGSNASAATTRSICRCPLSCCTSGPATPSWRVLTTNANTGVRRRRNPT